MRLMGKSNKAYQLRKSAAFAVRAAKGTARTDSKNGGAQFFLSEVRGVAVKISPAFPSSPTKRTCRGHRGTAAFDPTRTFLHQIGAFGKGPPPGSLTQKQIDLLEEPSSGRFVLQKEMIPPRKRYEPSTGYPCCHLTARLDRTYEIIAHMHDERWHVHLWEQFAHIEISDDFEVASGAFG